MNGSYNNTLDDVLANPAAEILWMGSKGKVNPYGWDHVSLYGVETFNSAFGSIVLQLYLKKIRVGIAVSRVVTLDAIIAYNKAQTDFRKKVYFITTELEAEYANNNCTIAEFRTWIPQWYAKCKAAGILMKIYEGWNYNYDITVPNSDGFFLHAYRTAAQMATVDDMYKYMTTAGDDRWMKIAAESKKIGKITEVSVLPSVQPSYGAAFYQTRPWGAAEAMVRDSFHRLGTQDMKDFTIFDGEFIFASKYMKPVKP